MKARRVRRSTAVRPFAVVGIPPEAERDVLKGTTLHVPM